MGLAATAAVILTTAPFAAPAGAEPAAEVVSVSDSTVPTITSWVDTDGTMRLTGSSRVVVDRESRDRAAVAFGNGPWVSDRTAVEMARTFARDLEEVSGLRLPVGSGIARPGDISFVLRSDAAEDDTVGADGYRLNIADGIVTITANTTSGLYYGGRSVLQSLSAQPDHRTLRNGHGVDVPDLEMRTYTMDVSREYWEPRVVEDVIRQMGWQKQNVLIFHFDDAEYFRLNSPAYPGLAEPAFSYDEATIKRLVELGAENNVTVMPAFEYPAHVSAKASYFHIGMDDGPLDVEPGYGPRDTGANASNSCGPQYTHSHLNPDFTFNFMHPKAMRISKEMLDVFVPWFESPWVHIGGDEVPPQLANCPALQEWFASQDEVKSLADAEAWFINDLADHLADMGKRTVVYNGFENGVPAGTQPKVDEDVVVQLWTGSNTSAKLAQYDKILGNESHYYLVTGRAQSRSYPNTEAIYNALPAAMHADLDDPKHLGLGMHIWGDDLGWAEAQYLEQVAYYPRSLTAERTWNASPPADGSTTATFRSLLERVGPAPGYVGIVEPTPTSDGRPIHSWVAAEEAFPPGTFDAHRGSHRRPLTEVCGLNGMTPLSSNVSTVDDPVQGRVKRLGGAGAAAGWHMGASEIYGDWTFAVNLKVPATVTGRVQLFDSRTGTRFKLTSAGTLATQASSIDFALPGSGEVGFVDDGVTTTFGYKAPRDTFVQLVFVSENGRTRLFANGAEVAAVDATLPLPRAWFAATRSVELQGMQIYAQALSAQEVAQQAGVVPQPEPAHCQPRRDPVVPADPAPITDFMNFSTTVETRCVGRNVRVDVAVTNDDTSPGRVAITTPFGTHTIQRVAPGRTVHHPFTTTQASVSDGTITVRVDGRDALDYASSAQQSSYASLDCG